MPSNYEKRGLRSIIFPKILRMLFEDYLPQAQVQIIHQLPNDNNTEASVYQSRLKLLMSYSLISGTTKELADSMNELTMLF